MIKIEFFHDVVCSFCFPMSARIHKIEKKLGNLDIIHRSFALGWDGDDYVKSFGSREAVKSEVLNHWVHANTNDDEHRFNIEGMRLTDFDFPISRPGLIAAKAAGIIGGESAYWEVFDEIQYKLFVENKNIEDVLVLEEAVGQTSVSLSEWKIQFEKSDTEAKVLEDLQLGQKYGVRSVPSLVINNKYLISGAQSQENIEKVLRKILDGEDDTLL